VAAESLRKESDALVAEAGGLMGGGPLKNRVSWKEIVAYFGPQSFPPQMAGGCVEEGFGSSSSAELHYRQDHTGAAYKVCPAPGCKYVSYSLGTLKQHMRDKKHW